VRLKFPEDIRRRFVAWGRKGGKERAKRLTAEQRQEQARKAAQARWQKAKRQTGNR